MRDKRRFNVVINGRKLHNIDVFKAAVFRNQYSRTVWNMHLINVLSICLQKVKGDPFLGAVSCERKRPLPQNGLPANFFLNIGGPAR